MLMLCFHLKTYLVSFFFSLSLFQSLLLEKHCPPSYSEGLLFLLFQAQACLTHYVFSLAFKLRCNRRFSFYLFNTVDKLDHRHDRSICFSVIFWLLQLNHIVENYIGSGDGQVNSLARQQFITFRCVNRERVKLNYSRILFLNTCLLKAYDVPDILQDIKIYRMRYWSLMVVVPSRTDKIDTL